MRFLEDSFPIIILGKWNTHILSPGWIAKNILGVDEVEVEVAVNAPDLPMRINHQNVLITAANNRVMVLPQRRTMETFVLAEEIVRKITEILQYTPVSAYGVNFNFIEDDPAVDLIARLKIVDSNEFVDRDMRIVGTSITRNILIEDTLLNFSLIKDATNFKFRFNFHYEVNSAIEVSQGITGKFMKNITLVEQILNDIYGYSFAVLEG